MAEAPRRNEAINPFNTLQVSHRLSVGATITPHVQFPGKGVAGSDPKQAFAAFFTITRTAAGANGVIFEMGDAALGFACYLNNNVLEAVAGPVADDAQVVGPTLPLNEPVDVVVSVPDNRSCRIAVTRPANEGPAIYEAFSTNPFADGWTAAEVGEVGDIATAIQGNVPGGAQVALVNASLVGDLVNFCDGDAPEFFAL